MGRYDHLNVYKSTYTLSKEIHKIQLKLPKNLKYGLGAMFFESALRCIKGIIFANGSQSKAPYLREVALEIEMMWTYLRLLFDMKGISKGEFQVLSERIAEISPQITAWMKWEKSQNKNQKVDSTKPHG